MTKETFVAGIEEYSDMMYRVALSILRNEEDCRDALQDAVLKAWEKRTTLKDEQSFKPWLTRIVINNCNNVLRRRRRIVALDDIPEPSSPPPDPTLSMVLESLPESLRLPLVLVYSEGMSYAEAAQAMRVPVGAIRGRIHRAKEQLRKELREE